uniref:Uncharacterized protein n=1 Tax=Lactuca sativa TaxID=4236 RepID=A0A9R1XRQ3_LACSA|nr:hypothetical protein LSAT_V11C100047670 [Lactuca sativa]
MAMKGQNTSQYTLPLVCFLIILMDVIAGILGIQAEVAQNQVQSLRVWIVECRDPSNKAFKLGFAAAVLLAFAHAIANILGGCHCVRSREELDNVSYNKRLAFGSLVFLWYPSSLSKVYADIFTETNNSFNLDRLYESLDSNMDNMFDSFSLDRLYESLDFNMDNMFDSFSLDKLYESLDSNMDNMFDSFSLDKLYESLDSNMDNIFDSFSLDRLITLVAGFIMLTAGVMANSSSRKSCGISHHRYLSIGGIACIIHAMFAVCYYISATTVEREEKKLNPPSVMHPPPQQTPV